MSYFPSDIPFMSEEELRENGIRIPKDTKRPDLYVYSLDLNVKTPVIEKFPAKIREGSYGDEVIRWIGPNDYEVWHSEFDSCMIGVVNEPLDNVVELIVKRDDITSDKALMLIQSYCCDKAARIRKKLDMFYRGIGAATEAYVRDSWNVGQKGEKPNVSLQILQSLNRTYTTEGMKSGGEPNELKQN